MQAQPCEEVSEPARLRAVPLNTYLVSKKVTAGPNGRPSVRRRMACQQVGKLLSYHFVNFPRFAMQLTYRTGFSSLLTKQNTGCPANHGAREQTKSDHPEQC